VQDLRESQRGATGCVKRDWMRFENARGSRAVQREPRDLVEGVGFQVLGQELGSVALGSNLGF